MYIPATDDFDALVYNEPHPGTMNYIQQKFEHLSTNISEAGRAFVESARHSWDRFMGSEAMRRARAVKNKVMDGFFVQETIQPLQSLGAVQNAGLVMQRWIMACPDVRQMYYDQRIDGYSATYVDMNPGAIRDEDYNYRRVMDGVVQDTEDGGYHIRFYVEDLQEDDRRLRVDEKADILNTWSAVMSFLEAGKEDPTSQTAGMM